jgi:hypothetical protein
MNEFDEFEMNNEIKQSRAIAEYHEGQLKCIEHTQ